MKVPTVSVCCCGCTLKTGCMIIGSFWAVSALIMLIGYSVEADEIGMLLPNAKDDVGAYMAVRGMLIMYAVLACAQLIISICLIYGTYTYKASYIYPWLTCYTVLVVINLLGYLSMSIICFASFNVGSGFAILFGGLVNCALTIYCLIVVNSHYLILRGDITQFP